MQGGFSRDKLIDEMPRCLCGKALPKTLTETTRLRAKYSGKRILTSNADVSDEFTNVCIAPDEARNACYGLGDVWVADL